MKIGIIGAGNVGSALGKGWTAAGHMIKFGVRDKGKLEVVELLKTIGLRASAGTVPEAVAFGDVVVLATPWKVTSAVLAGAGNLAGKILIDCTNPLKQDLSGLDIGLTTSGGEEVAKWARGARVVKAFNTTGADNLANARLWNDRPVMFIAGDDPQAKISVKKLAEDLTFEVVDAGPLAQARLLEPVAMLWIHLALKQGLGVNFAFKLLRR